MTSAADLVAYEDDLVAQGITENPAGSNNTIIGQRFGWNLVAWCAETQSVSTEAVFGRRIGWSAAVSEWIAMAKRGDNGMSWVPKDGWIEAGMLVTYDFGSPRGNSSHFHIAMVRDPGTQGTFQTNGGNEGDAMRQQWRDRKYVQGFIALPFDNAAPPAPAPGPQPRKDKVIRLIKKNSGKDDSVWLTDLVHKWHVTNPTMLTHFQNVITADGGPPGVAEWDPADVDAIPTAT